MKLFKRKPHPTVCPKCGGKVVPIVYGMPMDELQEKANRGDIILGGCCISLDEPPRPRVSQDDVLDDF